MKRFFISQFVFLSASYAYAHIPEVIEQTSLHDITTITDPELSQAFYGRLDGYPHTFEIRSGEAFNLHIEVLLPDVDGISKELSGIVIRETGLRGKVSEVARMLGRDAEWESFYEAWGGDTYLRGGELTRDVEAGVYRIEVSTPDNKSPYVLVVGAREDWGEVGYFEMIGRIASVKEFFGKPKIMVVQSPLVYIPLLILIGGGILYYWHRRRLGAFQ